MGGHFSYPLDAGFCIPDGQRLLGSTKTYRGLLAAIVATLIAAPILGFSATIGVGVALSAMVGDLLSSFVKRRLGMPSSSKALGLDQIPESLLPLLICREMLNLAWPDVAMLVLLFLFFELLISRFLFRFHLRNRPY